MIKKKLISLFSKIYSSLVLLNLIFLHKIKKIKNLSYPSSLGFGDSFEYCLSVYSEVLKRKKTPLSFGGINQDVVSFFFKKYYKLFIQIYKFLPYYSIVSNLSNSRYYKPDTKLLAAQFLKNRTEKKKILKSLINKIDYKENIFNFCKKKRYICIFIKHYSSNILDFSASSFRQTARLTKIVQLITFLKKNNIIPVILGIKSDKSITYLKNLKLSDLYYSEDIISDFNDLMYLIDNSQGYIGSLCGWVSPFFYLNKKILCIDTYVTNTNLINQKNLYFLHKTIIFSKKKKRPLNRRDYFIDKKIKFNIQEANFKEIKNYTRKIFISNI
jgi:hypothetical protein